MNSDNGQLLIQFIDLEPPFLTILPTFAFAARNEGPGPLRGG